MVRQIVSNPDVFMERQIAKTKMRWEILIVLFIGALGIPGIYYVGTLALEASSSQESMQFAVFGRIVRVVVIVLLLWIGYSIAFHFLSKHFRGRGAPRRLLKGTAWAMTPLAIGKLVQSAALYLVFSDIDVSNHLDGYTQQEQMQSVIDAGMGEPILLVSSVILLGTLLWSAYLMTFVVEHAKNITRENAIKVVAIPVGVQVLFIVLALVQGTANFGLLI